LSTKRPESDIISIVAR